MDGALSPQTQKQPQPPQGLGSGNTDPRGSGTRPLTADQTQGAITRLRISNQNRLCSSDGPWTCGEAHLPRQEGVHSQGPQSVCERVGGKGAVTVDALPAQAPCACMYTHAHAGTGVHTQGYMCTHACTRMCIHKRSHTCMHRDMFTCMQI